MIMVYEIYLDNQLLGDNLGISFSNNILMEYTTANNGDAVVDKYTGDKSIEISFDIYTELGTEYNNKMKLIDSLLSKNKTDSSTISFVAIDDESSNTIRKNIKILDFHTEFNVEESTATLSFTLVEIKPFTPSTVKFNTFNYKPATTTTKKTSTKTNNSKTNSKYSALLNCKETFINCNKTGVACVKLIQTLLKSDGYYLNYKIDGWGCTYTDQEYRKWQKKKAKVKVTGKLDKATKTYLKKRFG